jgi:iron complex outermembrane recepter protein
VRSEPPYPTPSALPLGSDALGVAKDNWTAQIQCNNLSNAYGPTMISSDQFIKSEIPLRPRVITFLIGYRF